MKNSSSTKSGCYVILRVNTDGQAITEFIIILPALLLMMCCVVFFARMLILKQHCVIAARYIAWYAGRNEGLEPQMSTIRSLFFDNSASISITHPSPHIGFADNSAGGPGDVLGSVSGIDGTEIKVKGALYPFLRVRLKSGSEHFVFLDTWKGDSTTGKALKYAFWAIAVARGFRGSSINIDLENPSIP